MNVFSLFQVRIWFWTFWLSLNKFTDWGWQANGKQLINFSFLAFRCMRLCAWFKMLHVAPSVCVWVYRYVCVGELSYSKSLNACSFVCCDMKRKWKRKRKRDPQRFQSVSTYKRWMAYCKFLFHFLVVVRCGWVCALQKNENDTSRLHAYIP